MKPQPDFMHPKYHPNFLMSVLTLKHNIETIKCEHSKRQCNKFKTSKKISGTERETFGLSTNNGSLHERQKHLDAITKTLTPLMRSVANKVTEKANPLKKIKSQTVITNKPFRFRSLSGLKVTSLFSLLTLLCLETVLLSTVSNCAKTFYMHWNTSNSIFRIDNTDHIIDVNKGNLAFEFDQVHIICPVYEPGTFENETEKYIIYNVSKVEYETCRITNADPRVIAICDKPQKLMFFTITFRPFTPQPGGLEFLPGNDYYFISTSSKDDLYRRIGGRCSTNNMKVVFKVCCVSEEKNNQTLTVGGGRNPIGNSGSKGVIDSSDNIGSNGSGNTNFAPAGNINRQHTNSIGTGFMHGSGININNDGGLQRKTQLESTIGTSINTNIDQYNRIPTHTNDGNVISYGTGSISLGGHGNNGILLTTGNSNNIGGAMVAGGNYIGHQQSGIRINNVPTSQKNNNGDEHYSKHPNEVVKNEELTYNSGSSTLHNKCCWKITHQLYNTAYIGTIWSTITTVLNSINIFKNIDISELTVIDKLLLKFNNIFSFNINPIIIISILLVTFSTNIFKFHLRITKFSSWKGSLRKSTKSSYLPLLSTSINSPSIFTESNGKFLKKSIFSVSFKKKLNNRTSNNEYITLYQKKR